MAQPYVGEIRIFAGNFAPAGWLFCDGSLLVIPENETLYNLIGTTYGGNGQTNFALPDLRGRLPVHQGGGLVLAQSGGVETVTLSIAQMPTHSHQMVGTQDVANSPNPGNSLLGRSPQVNMFLNSNPTTAMSAASVTKNGGGQPHANFQPYLCLNFIISLFGIYPSPT